MRVSWKLTTLLDCTVIFSLAVCLLIAVGGQIHWDFFLFEVSATRLKRPATILVAATLVKVLFGLNEGLFWRATRSRWRPLAVLCRCILTAELRLRHLLIMLRWKLALAAVTLCFCTLLVEFYARTFTETLPVALANYIATGYHTGPSGIYRFCPGMKMLMMRSRYEREMYFNGYRWHHKTDSMGFRNPQDRTSADVILLGDSMIYGHGLDEPSTVRHHLERILDRPVANLGIQGAGIHHEYQILKRFGLALHPKFIFLFFLVNDIDDVMFNLTDDEMERFLRIPVQDHASPYFDPIKPPRFKLLDYLRELYVFKAMEFWRSYGNASGSAHAAETSWEMLPLFAGDPRRTLAMRFHLHALRKIQDLSARNNAVLVHMFIPTGGFREQEPVYEQVIRSFCAQAGILFYDLNEGFSKSGVSRARLILKGDGHWSDRGAEIVARLLAAYMKTGRFEISPGE